MNPSNTNNSDQGMSLRALLADIVPSAAVRDVAIADLTIDSRCVQPGAAFIALAGSREHGLQYAAQAVQRGAVAILFEPHASVGAPDFENVECIAVPNLPLALGTIADRFFCAPSQAIRIAGITGTNGKTTVAWFVAAAAQHLGMPSAYAGTLGVGPFGALRQRAHTTPDCVSLHRELASLCAAGICSMGMEISSHALHQARTAGVRVQTAVFTNLTHDHLDYHGTLQAYAEAKAMLFDAPEVRCAVINSQDAVGRALIARLTERLPVIAFSAVNVELDQKVRKLYCEHIEHRARGIELALAGDFGSAALSSQVIGAFNAENLLAALGVLLSWDVPFADAVAALEHVSAPPGRMQTLTAPGLPLVVVDYAHTPDALAKALRAARICTRGQLACVFGCGGERDAAKRPIMGEVAARLADRVVITDDNPRGEDGSAIAAQILTGMVTVEHVLIERDRARAIELALAGAHVGDVVLVAGKGHEDYQIVGTQRRHFSDAQIVRQWMERHA